MSNAAQLTGQAELAEARQRVRSAGRRERLTPDGTCDRECDREVRTGILNPDTADHVDEHIRGAKPDPGVPSEHRQHECDAVSVKPRHHPPRRHQLRSRDQRLHLHEQRSRPLHRAQHHAAGGARGLPNEPRGRIEHFDEPVVSHLEHPRLVRGAEPVLDRPDGAVGPFALSLELKYAIDEVLEHSRAGERAVLGDVADEHHRDFKRLGHAHDFAGDLADL